ncbi:MAG: hypothetical protein WC847_00905 [Candidatus Paceibacterota bacterium]|jgi:uncharacterized membrane protein YbaN (DUF454 family)
MKKQIKKIIILVAGTIFILLGLLGLVLPFLQGILFLAIGFALIFFYFPDVRSWVNEHTKKYPHLFKAIEKVEKWMVKIIGEI